MSSASLTYHRGADRGGLLKRVLDIVRELATLGTSGSESELTAASFVTHANMCIPPFVSS